MNVPAALDALVTDGPAILATGAHPANRCILASKVALDVLAAVGISAEPAPMEVAVYTQAIVDHQPGGRLLLIQRTNTGPGWSGHLCVTGRTPAPWLLDFDLQQFHRPALVQDGRTYDALALPAAAWWPFDPAAGGWTWQDDQTGTYLTYRPLADDGYRRSKAWRQPYRTPLRQAIGRLVRQVRAASLVESRPGEVPPGGAERPQVP